MTHIRVWEALLCVCVHMDAYILCLHMYIFLLPTSHLKLLFNFLIDCPYRPKIQAPWKLMFTAICSMIRTVSDPQQVFNKYLLNKLIYKQINLVPFSPRSSKILFRSVLLSSRKERGVSQVTLVVKKTCLPIQETQKMWVRYLSQEDPLEEGMATHSSILAQRISGAWRATVHRDTKNWTRLKWLGTDDAERKEHVHRDLQEFSENNIKIQSNSHK